LNKRAIKIKPKSNQNVLTKMTKINIYVKIQNDKILSFYMSPQDTILDLKAQLQQKTGVPILLQDL